jgi:hypothetical protein
MRHIDERFIKDLLCGELSYFLNQVKNNRASLSLEIRDRYINIYYKGGNLLKITQKKSGYLFHFDAKYCKNKGNDENFELLNNLRSDDIDGFKNHFQLMMQEMDTWFEKHPKPERDYQHQLLINNPEIIDIEYQVGHRMRLDMLYFANNRLFVVENKYGTGAIGGGAGLSKHYSDIRDILVDSNLLDEMLDSVCNISQAKTQLGFMDSAIEKTDINSIEILFLLANYNPKSQSFSNEIAQMDGSVPASILMTTSDQVKIELSQAKDIFNYEN